MNSNIVEYQIRNYSVNDADQIGEFDKLAELSYRYNGDFLPVNIFCAVDINGTILGVAHLEPDDTWHMLKKENVASDFVYKMKLNVSLNDKYVDGDKIKKDLVQRVLDRALEIRKQYPNKKMRVMNWQCSGDYNEIDFYLSQGFCTYSNCLVLKYDLTRDIPDVPKPDGITFTENNMDTEEELQKYYEVLRAVFSGVTWSLNYLRWVKCGQEWCNFSVFHDDVLIGNTMTWRITEDRSATEEIFVVPDWRHKGVAKYVITETLKYLKKQGKSLATLSVFGDNRPAIALYKALGYKMMDVMIEIGYDL